jgi:hypothetical protein
MEEEGANNIQTETINFGKFNSTLHPIKYFYSSKLHSIASVSKMQIINDIAGIAVTKSLNWDTLSMSKWAPKISISPRMFLRNNQTIPKYYRYYFSIPKKIGLMPTPLNSHRLENLHKNQEEGFVQ